MAALTVRREGQPVTLHWALVLLIATVHAQAPAPAPGTSKAFSSDPGPAQAAGLQGSGGSSLVKLVHLQSLDQTVSDQQGVSSLIESSIADYVVSSVPLSIDEYNSAKEPLAQLPFLFSPLAIIYKYPGQANVTLNLDTSVLSQIFTCQITSYNSPSIKALNPGADLPASRFRPVVGSLNDSNTKILANSVWGVSTWSPQCVSITASATSADWLNPLSQVSLVAGRIGFVPYASVVAANAPEYSQQLQDLSVGAIRNENGTFVTPSGSVPFPYAPSALPQSIVSPQWAGLNASASALPSAYTIGRLAFFITTANLGSNGVQKGEAMRSIMLDLLSDAYQSGLADKGGVRLPQEVLVNLRQQVQSLQNVPPPASGAASHGASTALITGLAVGVPCVAAAAAAGVLIWWCCLRRRKTSSLSTSASARAHRDAAAKEGNLLATQDIVFAKDERGRRLLLGEGAFAKVFKAQWNGAEAAVKILHDQGEKQKAEFLHEASILKGLRHPNVVDYFGLAFSDKDEMMLVMELVGGGNLGKALSLDRAQPRRLGWHRNGRFVLLGIARGLAFIHSRNIIVFDIKAGNVLLDTDRVTAKITDVGLSKMLAGSNTATLLRGTLAYMSPELFGAYSVDGPVKAPVTQAVDVYSFGVLMWEVISGEKPSRTASLRKIRVPEECPQEVEDLRRRCMSRDPKDRPTAAQVVNELDALARGKADSVGGPIPELDSASKVPPAPCEASAKVPPAPQPQEQTGSPLARISSGLKRMATFSKEQVQALSRKSGVPHSHNARAVSARPSGGVSELAPNADLVV